LLALQELADQLDERSLLTQGLESAERLTESKIGFLHFVNDDQETLELVTWTGGALRGCTAAYDNHYPISSAGIWADCFRNRAPMVVNDYATHTIKKGLPDGHAHLERFVSVPVIEGQRVCMMLGVGNKATAYTPTDVDTLQLIGNDLWRMARRRRAEQALQQRLHELEVVNKKLADLKLHLLQTEKLASIGQLAAGVAHEINNPIGFLRSNLSTMSGYVNGLIEVVKAYEAIEAPAANEVPAAVEAVRNLKQQTDHDFVVEELPTLIAESQDGIERVRKIVLDLKNFSRAGDTDWQWADLMQGLESTINIVWNQIKYKAELRREYQPMPQVYCIASQINQVVMNLLVNAVQSIDQTGTITVRTGADTTQAWIEVEDTGCGMTEEQKHHIFEPFFTTKPPGQGTGLGLAIAWRVMERHHGHFDIDSTVNQGTRIRINLPIDNRQTPAATLPAQDTPA
jgi:two-component system NtrC family sensor kinase